MYRCFDLLASSEPGKQKINSTWPRLGIEFAPKVERRSRNAKVEGLIPSRGQVELIFCLPGSYS
jgi:hypothetical protein